MWIRRSTLPRRATSLWLMTAQPPFPNAFRTAFASPLVARFLRAATAEATNRVRRRMVASMRARRLIVNLLSPVQAKQRSSEAGTGHDFVLPTERVGA